MKSLIDKLYERAGRALKVPLTPIDPNGETIIRSFKPAPRYAGYRLCRWVFTQLGIFIPFAMFLLPKELYGVLEEFGFGWIRQMDYNAHWQENIPTFLQMPVKILSVGAYVVQFIFSFFSTLLSAKSPSYLLTGYSLRIRRGLWVLKESTFSLKNIQQVKFSQNLLERFWGIGTLEVRTAGGGMSGKKEKNNEDKSHTGELVGLLDPITLRELVNATIKDASAVKNSLQTPTHPTHNTLPAQSPEFDQAVQELLLACQSLKQDVAASKS